jgi:hypothetical protein
MTTEPAYVKNFKSLFRREPAAEHVDDIEHELYALGSDRATAVLFASLIETHLRNLVLWKMRHDLNSDDRQRVFDPDGPLGDFGAKIIIAQSMILISSAC